MGQEVYCIAQTEDQAREIVERLKAMGIGSDSIKVIRKPAEIAAFTHHASDEARNAANGAVAGTVIGVLFGIAVLGTMGFDRIPGLFEGLLMLACGALGGAMFGAIVGSTGLFAKKRVLISVDIQNIAERDRLIKEISSFGVYGIHYSGELAA
jgi:hypothetical protein